MSYSYVIVSADTSTDGEINVRVVGSAEKVLKLIGFGYPPLLTYGEKDLLAFLRNNAHGQFWYDDFHFVLCQKGT